MNTTTRLLLLPDAAEAAAICLLVDAGGRVLGRQVITVAAPLDGPSVQSADRQVLAVPGIECLALWLDLPTRNPVQALAAARLLIEDHIAGPGASLHVAPAAPAPGGGERLTVAVEAAAMQVWLERAAALGMTPDIVVPMPLLLPLPLAGSTDADGAGAVVVADVNGQWLVRGADLAFAAEPALAEQIIGGRPRQTLEGAAAEAAFATNALSPPVDLLQGAFAPLPARREGWPAWRRPVILAAILAVSPLLVLAAQAARYEFDARTLQDQANASARSVLREFAEDADPLPALRARLEGLRAGEGFAHGVGALMSAVASVDGAELDALAYANGELQATLVVATPAELARIRAALADAGLEMIETGSRGTGGRTRHAISVRPPA